MKKQLRYLFGFLLIIAFLFGLFYLRNAYFTSDGDDEVYRTSIETWGSWGKWAHAYYHGNSGRVLIHALLILFTNLPVIVWKLCSAGMIALSCGMLYRYATVKVGKRRLIEGILACVPLCLFCAIPGSVRGSSIRWAAGSVNYLYPVCAMLVCLFPFWKLMMGEKIGIKLKIAALLCVCLCGNMEQSSAVLSAMGLLCLGYYLWGKGKDFCKEHQKDIIFLAVIWLINTAVMLIGYLAPGNSSRYTEELLRFAGYNMYTLPEKFILGIQLLLMSFSSVQGLALLVIPSLLILAQNIRKRSFRKMLPALINLGLIGVQNILVRKVFNMEFLHPFQWQYTLWLGFSVALLFYNGYVILSCTEDKTERFWLLFTYYGMLAAGVVVCFSPTLYVSGGRTVYICYIMLIMIIMMMLRSVVTPSRENTDDRHLWSKVNGIFGIVASIGLVLVFLIGIRSVKPMDISAFKRNCALAVEDVTVDSQNGTVHASVSVAPFAYTADNWCSGKIDGYNINVHVGVLDTETGKVQVYRTFLHPQYPVMSEFPDERVSLTGYVRGDIELAKNQQFVMVYTDHAGENWYMPVTQNEINDRREEHETDYSDQMPH